MPIFTGVVMVVSVW